MSQNPHFLSTHFLKRVDSQIDWESTYRRIYNMSIDPYSRFFQYKIFNNCLYLNRDLFRFKIVESPICSFCSLFSETIDHIFVYCEHSRCLYREIRIWTKSVGIVLPELNIPNIILLRLSITYGLRTSTPTNKLRFLLLSIIITATTD